MHRPYSSVGGCLPTPPQAGRSVFWRTCGGMRLALILLNFRSKLLLPGLHARCPETTHIVEAGSKPLKANDRSTPQCAAFYLALALALADLDSEPACRNAITPKLSDRILILTRLPTGRPDDPEIALLVNAKVGLAALANDSRGAELVSQPPDLTNEMILTKIPEIIKIYANRKRHLGSLRK